MTEALTQSKLGCEYQERQRATGDREIDRGGFNRAQRAAGSVCPTGQGLAPQKCVSSRLHLEILQCMQYQSTRMLATPRRARQGRLESSERLGRNVLAALILQIEREGSPPSAVVSGAIFFIRISTLLWLPAKKLWRSHVGFVGWVHKSEDQSFAHFVSASKKSWELFNCQGFHAILPGHTAPTH